MKFLVAATVLVLALTVSADDDVSCYQCVSTVDKDCESSDLSLLESFKKACPKLKEGTFAGEDAVGCRKVIQNVEEETNVVVRECAYSGETLDGMKKTGNWAISKIYYQCVNEDGKPCNSSSLFSVFSVIVMSLVTLFQ